MARDLGVHPNTLYRARKLGWDGDPATLQDWKVQRRKLQKRRGPKPKDSTTKPDPGDTQEERDAKAHWDMRFRKAKARREELGLRKLMGELVEADLVQSLFVARIAEVRAALTHLPRQMARRLGNQPPEVIEDELEAACRGILERFARGDPLLDDPPEDSTEQEGAA